MEATYAAFTTWLSGAGTGSGSGNAAGSGGAGSGVDNTGNKVVDVRAVEFGYKGALAKLAGILGFEETLVSWVEEMALGNNSDL